MLTTFNIVGYINERELNKACDVLLICNLLHIDGTPHQLFSSLLVMYPTILNVVKHGKR